MIKAVIFISFLEEDETLVLVILPMILLLIYYLIVAANKIGRWLLGSKKQRPPV